MRIDNVARRVPPSDKLTWRDRQASAVMQPPEPTGQVEIPFPKVNERRRYLHFRWRRLVEAFVTFAPGFTLFIACVVPDVKPNCVG